MIVNKNKIIMKENREIEGFKLHPIKLKLLSEISWLLVSTWLLFPVGTEGCGRHSRCEQNTVYFS